MTEKRLTPLDVARMLKRSVQWVYDAIECKELKAVNLSLGTKKARWSITPSDLQEFLENRENIKQ